MTSDHKKEIDATSGVETTGHEWDGIKELNNPAPRWWLWVFYICVIWSIGYWVVYPAWPTLSGEGVRGGTPGNSGWTQYTQLKEQQQEIIDRKGAYLERFHNSSFGEIMNDPELYAFAIAGGKSAFKDNCATCHGTGGAGGNGYPNLNDDDWLWGGTVEEIHQTLQYGVRSGHENEHINMMPAFGDGMLNDEEIDHVAEYVMALATPDADMETEAVMHGAEIYEQQCVACHMEGGKGDSELGAPALNDAIWLYAGNKESIVRQVKQPRHGVMPYWKGRLSDETIRQLAVYVHSLGGGEASGSMPMPADADLVEEMEPEADDAVKAEAATE